MKKKIILRMIFIFCCFIIEVTGLYSVLNADMTFEQAVEAGKTLAHDKLDYMHNLLATDTKGLNDRFGNLIDNSSDNSTDKSFVKQITGQDSIDTTKLEQLYGKNNNLSDYVNTISSDNYTPENEGTIYSGKEFEAYKLIKGQSIDLSNEVYNSLNNPVNNQLNEGTNAYMNTFFADCDKLTTIYATDKTGHVPDIRTCEKINEGAFTCSTVRKYQTMISNDTADVVINSSGRWLKECPVTNHSNYYYSETIDNSSCQNVFQNLANAGLTNCHVVSVECDQYFPIKITGETGQRTITGSCNNDTETDDHQCGLQSNYPFENAHCQEVIHNAATWSDCENSCTTNLENFVFSTSLDNVVTVDSWSWSGSEINTNDYDCMGAEIYRPMNITYTYRNPDCTINEGEADLGYNKKCLKVVYKIVCGNSYNNYNYDNQTTGVIDTCKDYEDNCTFLNVSCLQDEDGNNIVDESGNCSEWEYTYDCGQDTIVGKTFDAKETMQCSGNINCMGTDCTDRVHVDETLADLSKVEIALKTIDKGLQTIHSENFKLFQGEQHECTKAPMWGINCCSSKMSLGTSFSDALNYMKIARNAYKAAKYMGLYDKFVKTGAGQVLDNIISKITFFNPLSLSGGNVDSYYLIGGFADKILGHDFASQIFQYQADEYGSYFATGLTDTMSAIISVVGTVYSLYEIFNTIGAIFFKCTQNDQETIARVKMGLCHYVGTYCKKKVLGKCLQKAKFFCCYQDYFQLWFTEQLRSTNQPQLASYDPAILNWKIGSKTGNCGGLPVSDMNYIDASNFDVGPYLAFLAKGFDTTKTQGGEQAVKELKKDWFDNYITQGHNSFDEVKNEITRRTERYYDNGTDRYEQDIVNYVHKSLDNLTQDNVTLTDKPLLLDTKQGDSVTTPDGIGAENNNIENFHKVDVINSDQNITGNGNE